MNGASGAPSPPSPLPNSSSQTIFFYMFNVVSQVISNHYLDHETCSFHPPNDQDMESSEQK